MAGAFLEILLSALLAPVLMLMQVRQVWEIVSGRDSGWSAQRRSGEAMTWGEAFAHHRMHVIVGVLAGAALLQLSPDLLAWTSPVLAGLVLAPALSRMSGDRRLGSALGVLDIPEDRTPPDVVKAALAAERAVAGVSSLTVVDIAADPALRADHLATLPARTPEAEREQDRLAEITARAKIEAATDARQAIGWLNREETIALLSSGELMTLLGSRSAGSEAPSETKLAQAS